MKKPLLSFAVPTYNRPEFLDALLASVADEIHRDPSLESAVEVVVSDNASEPSTLETVKRWQERLPNTISYRRNSCNLGGPGNLVAAIVAARGTYVMYIGDDDRLRTGAGSLIRKTLLSHGEPPICIFANPDFLGTEEYALGSTHETRIDLENAVSRYFFAVGIPGGTAIRADFAKAAIARVGYDALALTNWPQTLLACLAAIEAGEELPIVVRHEIIAHVSKHHDANTIYTAKTVWSTWVQGLVSAAQVLEDVAGRPLLAAACADIFTPRRLSFPVEKVIDHLLFVDDPDEVASFTKELEESLENLPNEYQRVPIELIGFGRTKKWMRIPRIISRKLFSSPLEILLRPKQIKYRMKSLIRLIHYSRHHKLMVKKYANGDVINVRDYSREGY